MDERGRARRREGPERAPKDRPTATFAGAGSVTDASAHGQSR